MILEPENIILVDVDDVLADYTGLVKDRLKLAGYTDTDTLNLETEDIADSIQAPGWREFVKTLPQDPSFCRDLKPTLFGKNILELVRNSNYIPLICTSPPRKSADWATARLLWLKEYYNISQEDVIYTKYKYLVKAAALIDDRPSHINPWTKYNPEGIGILWDVGIKEEIDMSSNLIRVSPNEAGLKQIDKILKKFIHFIGSNG